LRGHQLGGRPASTGEQDTCCARDYYARQYANTQQVAKQGTLQLSELKPGLQKALGEIESLRTRISELELALGTAKRDGWREAFPTLDPVFPTNRKCAPLLQ
jgi:hypothetical protein